MIRLNIQHKQSANRVIKTLILMLVTGLWISHSQAKVTLDGSLGPAGPLPGPNYQINADDGRQAGTNLFHSFGKFNLNSSESATFTNQGAIGQIKNVLSRVTGGKSFIDGLLRSTIPDANLYFINPAGIVFGENARLDVQGSFHATTADYLRLGDGTQFNAIPSAQDAILATASPEAFGFLSENPSSISVNNSQLNVPSGETLSLIGNDLTIRNGVFVAPEGKINLISTDSAGEINLHNTDSSGEPAFVRGDINISENSLIDVRGDEAGSIYLDGKIIEISSSTVSAETESKSGGPIEIRADSLRLTGGSTIVTQTVGQGSAGAIKITAPSIEIDPGSAITSSTCASIANACSSGNAGNILIKVANLEIDGSGSPEITGIASIADIGSTGSAGTVEIKGIGQVKANKITVKNGEADKNLPIGIAGIGSIAILSFSGDANLTTVNAKNIELVGGGVIGSSTFSAGGDAGKAIVNADQIRISGFSIAENNFVVPSAIDSSANILGSSKSTGNAGIVDLFANQLILENGASLSSSTFTKGDAGKVVVNVKDLISITGGEQLSQSTGISTSAHQGSEGIAGIISIETARLFIDGDGSKRLTGIGSLARSNSRGNSGKVTVTAAKSVMLLNGGAISSSTFSSGNAGEVVVETGHLLIDGVGSVTPSGIGSSAESPSTGDAKNTRVTANSIQLRNGGVITSRSLGTGQIGDVVVKANEIEIESGATISANTLGLSATPVAEPGKVEIRIGNSLRLRNGGSITLETANVNAGDIFIDVKETNTNQRSIIQLSEDSEISTSVANGKGNGGNINIGKFNKPVFLVLDGSSRIIANAKEGSGGNINIATDFFFGSPDNITASSDKGIDGTVNINSPDTDISSGLLTLPDNFFDAKTVLRKPCIQHSGADVIRLVVRKYEVLPQTPYALWDHVPDTMLDAQAINSQAGDSSYPMLAGLQHMDKDCLGNE